MSSKSSTTIQSKKELSVTPTKLIENELNSRVKRAFTNKPINENNSNSVNAISIKIKAKAKKDETKNEEEKNEDIGMKKKKYKNEYNIFKELNEKNIEKFREKIGELCSLRLKQFKNGECKEFFLISRTWFLKLRDFLNNFSMIKFKELKDKMYNNDILLERQIMDKAFFLNNEKENIKIIKPKYAFCKKKLPYFATRQIWDLFHQIFGGGPEIKIESEKIEEEPGKFIYKRDSLKYIKINCIILPPKENIFEIKEYQNKILKEFQTFTFFFNKYKKITDLTKYLEQIIKKYNNNNIKLADMNNYKLWTDLNYYDFNKLFEKISKKIPDIYNIYNNNSLSPLNLEKIEKEDENESKENSNNKKNFGFKLFPLNTFSKEILMDIFPNQFTNNFDKLNEEKIDNLNEKLRNDENFNYSKIENIPDFNKYPEFNIIIEQIVGSFFIKSSKTKYKISECDNESCKSRGIMTKSCECEKKYYCSEKCKNLDKKYHEEECSELLLKYFLDINKSKSNIITGESLIGIKGIRNIGNTCYMNTAIQCLSNCVELRNYFLFGISDKDINKNNILGYKGLIAYGFEYIIKSLWVDKEKILDISKFKLAVGVCNERFRGMNQQDTHEFVTFLIDSLHEDLNRVKNKIYIKKDERDMEDEVKSKIEWNNYLRRNQSILVDLFYGLFKSTVTCQECKKTCVDFNSFSSLSLNLRNSKKKNDNIDNNFELTNKIDKLSLNSRTNSTNFISIEESKNEEESKKNKENINKNEKDNVEKKIIFNNENIINNLDIKIRTETISLNGNEKMDIINSPEEKQEILVGGKENESDIKSESLISNGVKSDNDYIKKIRIIFFFYSSYEKVLQFILPIKDKKELTYKVLLLKISKIFNKDPYSLYLYHIDKDKNIMNVFGENNYKVLDNENNEILFISEINKDIIEKNLYKKECNIFYISYIFNFKKILYTDRETIEKDLNKNKTDIIKYLTNVYDEKDQDCISINDDLLKNHYMNISKVYQLTLKNYIYEKDEQIPKSFYFPKIVVFFKTIKLYDIYIEIFNMKKNIILENNTNNNKNNADITNTNNIDIIEKYFMRLKGLNGNSNINEIFSNSKIPFYLAVQNYSIIDNQYGKEKYLFLNSKDKILKEIIETMIWDQDNFPNVQIILKIYWNPIYTDKVKNYLKPEKIDSFLFNLINSEKDKEKEMQMNGNKTLFNSNNKNERNKIQINNEECKSGSIKKNNNNFLTSFKKNKNMQISRYLTTKDIYNTVKKENKNEKFIEINEEISIMDSFEILREEEILDENNEWYCENCKKKQKAMKKIEIFNSPKILIIQIKRFNHSNKLNTKVNFPLIDLDISNYVISKDKSQKLKYDLFAVANHYGSLSFGHYTAFCKNSIKNKWYEFNDSYVAEITDESKIISQNAYVLFYRQKDLSKLNWKSIFHKQFININIDNPKTLIDFNSDFINNISYNNNDINEFDKEIIYFYKNKEQKNDNKMKNNENCFDIKENSKGNDKESNNFLAKKRYSNDKK